MCFFAGNLLYNISRDDENIFWKGAIMKIKNQASAGTLESSDAEVNVYPSDELKVEVKSSVYAQFGKQIEETVAEVLDNLDIDAGEIVVDDRGALDCTIRSRVQTAVLRANEITENIPWGDKI